MRGRHAGAGFIVQTFEAQLSVALAPLANGHPRQPIRLAMLNDRMRQGSGMGKGLKLLNLVIAEDQRRHRTPKWQGAPRVTLSILSATSGTAQ